jgi:hypothetical protein
METKTKSKCAMIERIKTGRKVLEEIIRKHRVVLTSDNWIVAGVMAFKPTDKDFQFIERIKTIERIAETMEKYANLKLNGYYEIVLDLYFPFETDYIWIYTKEDRIYKVDNKFAPILKNFKDYVMRLRVHNKTPMLWVVDDDGEFCGFMCTGSHYLLIS